MRKIQTFKHLIFSCTLLFLGYCGSTMIGNPTSISVDVIGDNSGPGNFNSLINAVVVPVINLTEARVVLGELKFRQFEFCNSGESDSSEIEFKGPYVVDLLNNLSMPDLGESTVPAGRYCKIELKLDKLEDDEVPLGIDSNDPLVDHSAIIQGLRGDDVPFIVEIDIDEEFELKNEQNGFDIGLDAISQFFIVFDLQFWFEGLDLDTAEITQNTIYINKNSNEDLYDQFKMNLKTSANLFKDLNNNGNLDDDEDDDSLAHGGV